MSKITIKENVKFILQAKGLTQIDLAERLGVSKQNVQHLLNGNITLEKLDDIAKALNTVPAELVADPPLARRKTFLQRAEPTHTTLTCPHCGKSIKITAED